MWGMLIIIGIVLFVGLEFIKIEHHTKKLKAVLILVLAILLYFSVVSFARNNDVDMSSPAGVIGAVSIYFNWLGDAVVNLWDVGVETVQMTGEAIKGEPDEDDRRK